MATSRKETIQLSFHFPEKKPDSKDTEFEIITNRDQIKLGLRFSIDCTMSKHAYDHALHEKKCNADEFIKHMRKELYDKIAVELKGACHEKILEAHLSSERILKDYSEGIKNILLRGDPDKRADSDEEEDESEPDLHYQVTVTALEVVEPDILFALRLRKINKSLDMLHFQQELEKNSALRKQEHAALEDELKSAELRLKIAETEARTKLVLAEAEAKAKKLLAQEPKHSPRDEKSETASITFFS